MNLIKLDEIFKDKIQSVKELTYDHYGTTISYHSHFRELHFSIFLSAPSVDTIVQCNGVTYSVDVHIENKQEIIDFIDELLKVEF